MFLPPNGSKRSRNKDGFCESSSLPNFSFSQFGSTASLSIPGQHPEKVSFSPLKCCFPLILPQKIHTLIASPTFFSFRNLHQKYRCSLINRVAQSSYYISSSQSKKITFNLCLNDTILFTMWPSSADFCLDISATLIRNCCTVENKILVLNL